MRYARCGFGDVSEDDYRAMARDFLGADDFERAQDERAAMMARAALNAFAWQCARRFCLTRGVEARFTWGKRSPWEG